MYYRTQSADGKDRTGQQRLVVPSTSTTQTSTADKVFLQVIGLPPTAKGAPFKFKLGLSSNFGTLFRSLPLETYRPTESPQDMPPILSWGGLALTEQMTPLSVGMRPGEHNAAIIEVSYASPSRSYFIKVSDHPQYRPPQEVPPMDVAARQHNDRYRASSAGHSSAATAAYVANTNNNHKYKEESPAASQSRPLLPYEYPRIIKAVVPHASSAPLLPYPKDGGAPSSSSTDTRYYPNPQSNYARGDAAAPAGTPTPTSAISASFVVSGAKQQTRVHVRSPDRQDQGSSVNSNTINNINIPKSSSANHPTMRGSSDAASGLIGSKPAPRSTSQQSGIAVGSSRGQSPAGVRQRSPSARMVDTVHQALHGGGGGTQSNDTRNAHLARFGVGNKKEGNPTADSSGNRVGIYDRRPTAGGGPSTSTTNQQNHSRPHVVTSAPSVASLNEKGLPSATSSSIRKSAPVVVDSGMVETPRRRAGLAAPSLPRAASPPSSSSASPIPRQSVGIVHVNNDDTVAMQSNHSPPANTKYATQRLLSPVLLPSPSSYAATVTYQPPTVGIDIVNATLSPRQYKQRDEDALSSPTRRGQDQQHQQQHASNSGYFGGELVPASYVTAAAPSLSDVEQVDRRGGNADSSHHVYYNDGDRTSNTNTTAAKRQAPFAVTETSGTYRAAPLSDPEQTAIYRGSGGGSWGGGDVFAEVSQSQNEDNNASITHYHYNNTSINKGNNNKNENENTTVYTSSGSEEDPRRAAMREAVLAGQNSVLLAIASSKHADHGQSRSQEERPLLLPPESSRRGEESTAHFSPQPHRISSGDGNGNNGASGGSSLLLLSPKQGYVAPTPFNQDVIEAEATKERRIAQLGKEPFYMSGQQQNYHGMNITPANSYHYGTLGSKNKVDAATDTKGGGGQWSSNANTNGVNGNEGRSNSPAGFTFSRVSTTHTNGPAGVLSAPDSSSADSSVLLHHQPEFLPTSQQQRRGWDNTVSHSSSSTTAAHADPLSYTTKRLREQSEAFKATLDERDAKDAIIRQLLETLQRQQEALERGAIAEKQRQQEQQEKQYQHPKEEEVYRDQYNAKYNEDHIDGDFSKGYSYQHGDGNGNDAVRGRGERAQAVTDIVRGFAEGTAEERATNKGRQYFESDSTRAPSPTSSRAHEHRHNNGDEQKSETVAQVPAKSTTGALCTVDQRDSAAGAVHVVHTTGPLAEGPYVPTTSNINNSGTEDLIHVTKPAPIHLSNTPNASTSIPATGISTNPLFVTPLPPHREGLFVEQFLSSRTRDPLREALLDSGGEVDVVPTTDQRQRSTQPPLLPFASEDEPQPSQPSSDIHHDFDQHYAVAAAATAVSPPSPQQQHQKEEDKKGSSALSISDGARSAYLRRMASMEKRALPQQQEPLEKAFVLSSGPTPATVASASPSIAVPNTTYNNNSNVLHHVHYTQPEQQQQQGQRSASSSRPRVRNISTPRQVSTPRSDEYYSSSYNPRPQQQYHLDTRQSDPASPGERVGGVANNNISNTIPKAFATNTHAPPPTVPPSDTAAQPLLPLSSATMEETAHPVSSSHPSLIFFNPQPQTLSSTSTAGVETVVGNGAETNGAAGSESGGLNGAVTASVSAKTAIASRLRQATSQLEVLKLQLLQRENELAETAARNERLARQNANGIEKLESLRKTNAELAAKLGESQQVRGTLPPSAPSAATPVTVGNPIVDYTPFSSAPVNNNAATAFSRSSTTGASMLLGTPRPPQGDFVDSFVGGYGLANVSGIIVGNSTPIGMRKESYRDAVVTSSSATGSSFAQQQQHHYQNSDRFSHYNTSGGLLLGPEVAPPLCAQPPQEPLASSTRGSVVGIGSSGGVGVGGSRGSSMVRAGSSTGAPSGGGAAVAPSYTSAPSPLTAFKSQRN